MIFFKQNLPLKSESGDNGENGRRLQKEFGFY